MVSPSSPDQHSHRSLHTADVPFDAASDSLADALRARFGVLKLIMIVLVALFVFSGMECIQPNEAAVVLRFGAIGEQVRTPGLSWALPFPVDQTLKVGVTTETLKFNDHWFYLRDDEKDMPLNRIIRQGMGLKPGVDGALLTGDHGLAHVKWSLVYKVDDLNRFVSNVSDSNDEKVKELLGTLLDHAAVNVAAQYTTADVTQAKTETISREVKEMINLELQKLEAGIVVETVEIPEATPPVQTRGAFALVTESENMKTTAIQSAQQEATTILNGAAGDAYAKLVEQFAALDLAKAKGDEAAASAAEAEVDRILEEEASGTAGTWIRAAQSNYTEAVQGIRGDVEEMQALLPEYERNPHLLVERIWQQTLQRMLTNPNVVKNYVPLTQKELRIMVAPDPEDLRKQQMKQIEHQGGPHRPPPDWSVTPPAGVESPEQSDDGHGH